MKLGIEITSISERMGGVAMGKMGKQNTAEKVGKCTFPQTIDYAIL